MNLIRRTLTPVRQMLASVAIFALVLSLLNGAIPFANATTQGSGAVWTNTGPCGTPQNVNLYTVGQDFYGHGSNFTPLTTYTWIVKEPGVNGATIETGQVTTDANGLFCEKLFTVAAGHVGGPYQFNVGDVKNDNFKVEAAVSTTGTLTIIKSVVNDNGGTKTAGDFQGKINGNNVPWNVAQTLVAGTYTVSETPDAGYVGTITGDCAANGSVALAAGETKTCTITNDDIAPKLTVTKVVTNNSGGTKVVADFPLSVGNTGVTSGVQNTFSAGNYVVSETNAAGYAAVFTGDCDQNGNVTLGLGQTKSCTITNDDIYVPPTKAIITVTKTVVNDNGGTLQVADFPLFVGQTPVMSGVALEVLSAGDYTVSETNQTGYSASNWGGDCAANGSLTGVALGQSYSCIITNNDIAPQLTVIKHVVNDDAGTAVAGDFTMNVTATNPSDASFPGVETTGTTITLDAGAYSTEEGVHVGYAVDYSADCSGTIGVGETKTCTVTNDDLDPTMGTITITKTVINDDAGTAVEGDFTYRIDQNVVTAGSQNQLAPGAHTVSEDAFAGYTASLWGGDCATDGSINVVAGVNYNCSITNNDNERQSEVPACTLTASSNPVSANTNFDLNWTTTGADYVELDDSSVALNGSQTTSIGSNTSYKLIAWNNETEDSVECNLTVNIQTGGGGGGGGGSPSPRCDAFTFENDELSWETRNGYDMSITRNGAEIFDTTDDNEVDAGTLFTVASPGDTFELTVNRGSKDDTCTLDIAQGEVLGDSTSGLPVGEVLGESTSVLPVGAPNTGAGGASSSPIGSLVALLGMILSLVALRVTKNG